MTRLGYLRVRSHERKGAPTRYRWSVYGADDAVLCRGARAFATERAAYREVERVCGLLASVIAVRRRRDS